MCMNRRSCNSFGDSAAKYHKTNKPTRRCAPSRLDVVYSRRCAPLPSDTAVVGGSLYAKRSDIPILIDRLSVMKY